MGRFIEDDHQEALFKWADMVASPDYPTNLMFAIPMGGKRDVREAVRMKRQGSKKGVPDMCLPVTNKDHSGLFIELKKPIVKGDSKPVVSAEQKYWLAELSKQGYQAVVCYGWTEAKNVIVSYLANKD